MQGLRQVLTRSIRTKVLLALLSLGLAGLLSLTILLRPTILARFDDQERSQLERDTRRAAALLQTEIDHLSGRAIDWSAWDDAYAYVARPSVTFEASNFAPSSFESARLNLLVYMGLDGQIIAARGYDLQRQRAAAPGPQLLQALTRPLLLADLSRASRHLEGLTRLPSTSGDPELWMVAARPVLDSQGNGPVRGVLILGQRLDARVLQGFRDSLQLDLSLSPSPKAFQALGSVSGVAQIQHRPVLLEALGASQIVGRMPLLDLNGVPAFSLEVTGTRVIHQLGVVTAGAVLLATGAVMLIFTLLTSYLLDVVVLARLALYRGAVRQLVRFQPNGATLIGTSPGMLQNLPVQGQDELSDLGTAFNTFLDEVGNSREQLMWQAQHDTLTGLANRQLLEQRVNSLLRRRRPLSLALIDLNLFKNINDTLGHQVGDEVLQVVARRLVQSLPGAAVVARLGGDEFAVLFSGPGGGVRDTLAHALRELTRPTVTSAGEVRLSGSAGLTVSEAGPGDGAGRPDWVTLLRHADVAMYQAKRDGLPICVFTPDLLAAVEERIALEHALETAMERQELRLVYQPIVRMVGPAPLSTVTGVEALLRWRHPLLGEIGPNRFIPLAEENGSITGLGRWVLGTALTFARRRPGLRVSVNVSASQLSDSGFVASVLEDLQLHGVSAAQLELEVTETAVLQDLDLAIRQLARLHAEGVAITLDDFGTGHSSLAVLCSLPIQKVKLDRTFVVNSLKDLRSEGVLRAVLDMAHDLQLEVVAEGIETVEQQARLHQLGCLLGQGYLFARPLEEPDAETFLNRQTVSGAEVSPPTPLNRPGG